MAIVDNLDRLKCIPNGQFSPLAETITVTLDTMWKNGNLVPAMRVSAATWASFDDELFPMTAERKSFLDNNKGRFGGYVNPELVKVVAGLIAIK